MKFGRNSLFFAILIVLLGGAIAFTHHLRPTPALLQGQPLFPVEPEQIMQVEWQVTSPKGTPITVTCRRQGDLWRVTRPYGNALCAPETLSDLLDAITSLRVLSNLGDPEQADFSPIGHLRLETVDTAFEARLGNILPMNRAQQLVAVEDLLVTADAATLDRLPKSPAALRTRSLIPAPWMQIRALEWRAPGQAFTRAQRMVGGAWSVAQPFPFEVKAEEVERVLEPLLSPKAITRYVLPADDAEPDREGRIVENLTSETTLAAYGLDEETATRVLLYPQESNDALALRFGKADPKAPGNVFCLLDGYQAIVSVSQELLAAFSPSGVFAPHFNDRPITGDLGAVTRMTLRGAQSSEAPMELVRDHGLWSITSPASLPADTHVAEAFLAQMLALTGDFIAMAPPTTGTRLCDVELVTKDDTCTLTLYSETADAVLLYRGDQQRLYRVERSALPKVLTDVRFEQTFVDKTVLSLSAASIQRIEVERIAEASAKGPLHAAVERSSDALVWQTVFPVGSYVNATVVDAWLTCFAELKAETILQNAEADLLQAPFLRITLDLKGDAESLRRILLVGTPSEAGSAPAMIQGRPILYRLSAETLRLLQESPVLKEELLQ